ncbi:MAG: non-heme iron oxygenase ferredoxin subunit [Ilumatobacter sp.]|nr:non-heme iron oxygenase ferredoxin subunit [Ilumatobacter sp.]
MSTITNELCALDDIESGTARRFDVAGLPVSVVRIDDDVYAIGDICSHAHVSLSEGEVWCDEREIECPKHSSAFSLLTGEPSTLPATQPVPVYDASVVDGMIVVTVTTADVSGSGEQEAQA